MNLFVMSILYGCKSREIKGVYTSLDEATCFATSDLSQDDLSGYAECIMIEEFVLGTLGSIREYSADVYKNTGLYSVSSNWEIGE